MEGHSRRGNLRERVFEIILVVACIVHGCNAAGNCDRKFSGISPEKTAFDAKAFSDFIVFASQCSAKVCLSALIVFKPLAGLELAALCLISPNTVTQGESGSLRCRIFYFSVRLPRFVVL